MTATKRISLRGVLALFIVVSMAVGLMPMTQRARAAGVTYYIDCAAGSDTNDGMSTSSPWKTFTNTNNHTFQPGDQILLKRGTFCSGIGTLKPLGSGTPANPITIGAYGTGALPHIDCDTGSPFFSCVLIKDQEAWVIRDLEVSGTPVDKFDGPAGIYIENTIAGAKSYFRIYNVIAHDLYYGISISGYKSGNSGELYGSITGNNTAYINDVVIDGVETYNNTGKGVHLTGNWSRNDKPGSYAFPHNTNIIVRNSNLHDNGGDGIVMACSDNVLVEYVTARYNGGTGDDRYGIWPWMSANSTVQFSEAAFGETSTNKGGGGLDCDYGTVNCVMQYNYVHDNQGPGILLIGYGNANLLNANVHYNLFVDNMWHATAPDDGELVVFGSVDNSIFHNNTIYARNRNNNPGKFPAVFLSTWGKFGSPTNLQIKNNIFYLDNNTRYIYQEVGGSYTFDYNLLYATSGNLRIRWGNTEYTTLAAFQAATGQDTHSIYANPLLVNPSGRNTSDYQIASNSLAVNAGTNLGALMGTRDFFGNAIPQGGAYDIGAHETGGGPVPTNTPGGPTPTSTFTPIPPTATATPSQTFTPTPGASTVMHVLDIWTTDAAGAPKTTFAKGETLYWHVKIVDQNGNPISGATVITHTTKPNGSGYDQSMTTGADGVAHFSKKTSGGDSVGTWTIAVTNVAKTGATYNPGANVKSSTTFVLQ